MPDCGMQHGSANLWHIGSQSVQRVGAFTALPTLIRQFGADPEPLIAQAGLASDAFACAENRVSYTALAKLLCAMTRATKCAHIGLLAGRLWTLSDFGALGDALRNSPTVGDALRTFTGHQHLNSGGGLVFVLERGGVVDFGYAVYHPAVTCAREIYDCALAVSFNILRELCGPGWFPSEAFLSHARPADPGPYRNLLKVHPRFDAEFSAVRFPAQWMDKAVAGADSERRSAALGAVANAAPQQFVEQVYRAVRLLLLHSKNSGDDVADFLSIHRRTLNRRLRGIGITFQQVLDEVRYEVGCQLLGDSQIALDDVAASLGYNGVSPFMRAFRRWTGTTPGHWRRDAARMQCVALDTPVELAVPLRDRAPEPAIGALRSRTGVRAAMEALANPCAPSN